MQCRNPWKTRYDLFSRFSKLELCRDRFYKKEVRKGVDAVEFFANHTELTESDSEEFYATWGGDLIYQWKLWASIYGSSALIGLCILIMVVHYDTVCLPKLWIAIFRDGSLAERNLTLLLSVSWAAGVHVCTSSLSVGEVQANVYFTSWIGK